MRNIYETIEEKIKRRNELEKQLKENKYPKLIYKKKLKELSEINNFFYKHGVGIYY